MNTKHTLGPWAIRDDDEDGVVSIIGGSKIVLARVRTATAEPGDENARLIAAAPELLDALIAIVDNDFGYGPEAGDIRSRFGNGIDAMNVIHNARASIAKATGSAA